MDKEYLGDGVYATFDGYQIWLDTLEGDKIALEFAVWLEVMRYGSRMFHYPLVYRKVIESGEESSNE